LTAVLVAVIAGAADTRAQDAGEAIGYIKNTSGEAAIERNGERAPAAAGQPLYRKDVLVTGADGTLGATLKDSSLLSLGPGSRLALETYLFEPDRKAYSFISRITSGTLQYVSGLISKLSPGSVKIETPVATLGLRGTRLLVKVDGDAN
jgi:hypothetical protein